MPWKLPRQRHKASPDNAFAWFNLGTNLTYFERYIEATDAYDKARAIGLPQRMLRYQFGPFIAYFHSGQMDDLLTLTEYALKITPSSEEALLWYGWAMYRQGKSSAALESFQKALERNPHVSRCAIRPRLRADQSLIKPLGMGLCYTFLNTN